MEALRIVVVVYVLREKSGGLLWHAWGEKREKEKKSGRRGDASEDATLWTGLIGNRNTPWTRHVVRVYQHGIVSSSMASWFRSGAVVPGITGPSVSGKGMVHGIPWTPRESAISQPDQPAKTMSERGQARITMMVRRKRDHQPAC